MVPRRKILTISYRNAFGRHEDAQLWALSWIVTFIARGKEHWDVIITVLGQASWGDQNRILSRVLCCIAPVHR